MGCSTQRVCLSYAAICWPEFSRRPSLFSSQHRRRQSKLKHRIATNGISRYGQTKSFPPASSDQVLRSTAISLQWAPVSLSNCTKRIQRLGRWSKVHKFPIPRFAGASPTIALDGDTLVLANAFYQDEESDIAQNNPSVSNSGRVFVYRRDPSGTWRREAILAPRPLPANPVGSDSNRHFGRSFALHKDRLVVGGQGCVNIFKRTPLGVWTREQVVTQHELCRFADPDSEPENPEKQSDCDFGESYGSVRFEDNAIFLMHNDFEGSRGVL